MSEWFMLAQMVLTLWAMGIGLSLIWGGPNLARRYIRRSFQLTVRFVRRAVGGLLLALGRWIRG